MDDLLVVELRFCANLAKDYDYARLGDRLTGDLQRGFLLEAGIELCIASDPGDYVAGIVKTQVQKSQLSRRCHGCQDYVRHR